MENVDWLFYLFKIYYQKSYADESEEHARFYIFQKKLKSMNDINSQNVFFSVRINQNADKDDIIGMSKFANGSTDEVTSEFKEKGI